MTGWIRTPWWDGCWVLSGLPIGLMLAGLSAFMPSAIIVVVLLLLLQTGHLLAPIALAWSHAGFRQLMLCHRVKYLAVPLGILSATIGIAIFASPGYRLDITLSAMPRIRVPRDLADPFTAMFLVYAAWNVFHFGMQNFGILSIYRHKAGRYRGRAIDMAYCLAVIFAAAFITAVHRDLPGPSGAWLAVWFAIFIGMLWRELRAGFCLPRAFFMITTAVGLLLVFWQGLLGVAIYAVNHWLVAIGLAAHVHPSRRPILFSVLVILAGMTVFVLLFVRPGFVIRFVPWALGARVGLGFVHFLYDRYLWKLSGQSIGKTLIASGSVGSIY